MSSLILAQVPGDALLKGLIAKAAFFVLFAVALLLALLSVWLILRKVLRKKPLKTKLVLGCLLTPALTLVFAYAVFLITMLSLNQFVFKPVNKRHCMDSMHTIAEASRRWAAEHDGRVPQDLLSLSNHLRSPQVLICPATGRFTDGAYRLADVSYEFAAPGISAQDTNTVLLRCVTHAHRAYIDGRVLNGN